LTEEDVVRGLNRLRFMQLTVVSGESSRVAKYRHLLAENLNLVPAELAILCELLVRGPQTVGELRTRCERMHHFDDLSAVDEVLNELINRETALVVKLPRQHGRKEVRFAHLFSGMPEYKNEDVEHAPEAARMRVNSEEQRIELLTAEVAELRNEMVELRAMVENFKQQFE